MALLACSGYNQYTTGIDTLTAKGLLLDMDGTLVNSDAVVERLWKQWADLHGLPIDQVLAVAHGRQGWSTMAELLPDRPAEINHAENASLLAEEVEATDGVVAIPGARSFLAAVANFPHALVTSASRALARNRMAAADLPLPALRITSEEVTFSKPDPEGFLKAAAQLGLPPQDCLVFEDSAAGIAAGKAAGMRVVGVGPRAGAHNPVVHVRDLTQITVKPSGASSFTLYFDH